MSGVGEQVHQDGATLAGFLHFEKGFSFDPSVFKGFLPGGAAFPLANDHMKALVAHIKRLSRALNTIAKNGQNLAFQHLQGFAQGKLFSGHHFFDDAAKIQSCHN